MMGDNTLVKELIDACRDGDLDKVKELAKRGVDVEDDYVNDACLFLAVDSLDKPMLEYFLDCRKAFDNGDAKDLLDMSISRYTLLANASVIQSYDQEKKSVMIVKMLIDYLYFRFDAET